MKVHLAAQYGRRVELCGYRDQLRDLGYDVQARWLDGKHQISDSGVPIGDDNERLVEGDSRSDSPRAAALREKFAVEDLHDVMLADIVINFTEPRSTASRGGRHVEFGIALRNMLCRLIVVGHRENIFHWLPDVEFYETWDQCFNELKKGK